MAYKTILLHNGLFFNPTSVADAASTTQNNITHLRRVNEHTEERSSTARHLREFEPILAYCPGLVLVIGVFARCVLGWVTFPSTTLEQQRPLERPSPKGTSTRGSSIQVTAAL